MTISIYLYVLTSTRLPVFFTALWNLNIQNCYVYVSFARHCDCNGKNWWTFPLSLPPWHQMTTWNWHFTKRYSPSMPRSRSGAIVIPDSWRTWSMPCVTVERHIAICKQSDALSWSTTYQFPSHWKGPREGKGPWVQNVRVFPFWVFRPLRVSRGERRLVRASKLKGHAKHASVT